MGSAAQRGRGRRQNARPTRPPRGNIPTFIRITDGKAHDVHVLDEIVPEAGAFYVMDRGYIDFERLYVFMLSAGFFVVRTKENVLLERRYSHPVVKDTGVRSDHTVILTTFGSAKAYPHALRRVNFLNAGIHPLPSGWRMHMRGIAGQKDSPDTISIHHPNIRAIEGCPSRVVKPNTITSPTNIRSVGQVSPSNPTPDERNCVRHRRPPKKR